MMALHWDKVFRLRFKEQSTDESEFHRKQYVRRMLTSGLITLVGILFMAYRFLPRKSILRIWLIAGVLLLVGIILVMAFMDFMALRKLFRIHDTQAANATRDLADELRRLREKSRAKNSEDPTDAEGQTEIDQASPDDARNDSD